MVRPAPEARRAPEARPEPTRRERLERLLIDAIRQTDEDGLVFLLKQADILRTNANAERIRREIEEYEREHGPGTATGPEAPELPPSSVEPSPDAKSYFLTLGKTRKVLTRAELGRIVEVCLKASDREAAGKALHTFLGRERSDILVDARISGPQSPVLASLYATVLDLSRQARG